MQVYDYMSKSNVYFLFYELIRVSIGTKDTLSRHPSVKEWKLLYDIAKKQSLIGICFNGLQKLGADTDDGFEKICMSEALYLRWMGMAANIQRRNEIVNRQCVELQKRLAADGLRSCLLKGQGIAAIYGEQLYGLRQSGDIDIWVDADMDIVLDYVFKRAPSKVFDMKHIHYDVFKDTEVELHWIPGVSPAPNKNRGIKRFYESHKKVFDNLVSLPSGEKVTVADNKMNAVYLLMHIQGHFLYEGIGMRQLMDYYFTLMSLNKSDRVLAKREIDALGVKKILSAVMYVESVVFGLDEEYWLCEPNKKLGKELLAEIMDGGNFGHYSKENNINNESRIHWAWRRMKRRLRLFQYDWSGIIFRPLYRMKVAIVQHRVIKHYNKLNIN